MKNKILLANDNVEINLSSLIDFLNSNSRFFKFEEYKTEIKIRDAIINPDTCSKLNITLDKDIYFLMVFTNKQYYNNYFFEEEGNILIASFYEWKKLTSLPKNNGAVFFPLNYIVVQIDPTFRHAINDKGKLGCIFDFCIKKKYIDSSMRASAICPYCNKKIKNKITSTDVGIAFEDIKTILNELGNASKWDEDILEYWKKKSAIKTQPNVKKHVFISYSHEDIDWLKRVKVHLKPLERESVIEIWEDTRIKTGDNWKNKIENALTNSKAAILLVSADFLASDFIIENELPQLLKIAQDQGTRIFQVIISPCCFDENSNLSQFQAVNSPNKTLIEMEKGAQERLLVQLARDIFTYAKGQITT